MTRDCVRDLRSAKTSRWRPISYELGHDEPGLDEPPLVLQRRGERAATLQAADEQARGDLGGRVHSRLWPASCCSNAEATRLIRQVSRRLRTWSRFAAVALVVLSTPVVVEVAAAKGGPHAAARRQTCARLTRHAHLEARSDFARVFRLGSPLDGDVPVYGCLDARPRRVLLVTASSSSQGAIRVILPRLAGRFAAIVDVLQGYNPPMGRATVRVFDLRRGRERYEIQAQGALTVTGPSGSVASEVVNDLALNDAGDCAWTTSEGVFVHDRTGTRQVDRSPADARSLDIGHRWVSWTQSGTFKGGRLS